MCVCVCVCGCVCVSERGAVHDDKYVYIDSVCFAVGCFEYETYTPTAHLRKGALRPHDDDDDDDDDDDEDRISRNGTGYGTKQKHIRRDLRNK